MTDEGGGDEIAADGTVDIGAAIQRGVELLAQQSVETPTFQLRNTFDLTHASASRHRHRLTHQHRGIDIRAPIRRARGLRRGQVVHLARSEAAKSTSALKKGAGEIVSTCQERIAQQNRK